MTTKKLSEETEQNPSEPQPHWSNNILGSPSLSNPFWSISVRGHSHIQVATRNVQWTFMGGYLNYMYVFVCGNCLTKTYWFLPSIGQLAMSKFFSAKCKFAIVPTKEYRKNLRIKLRPPITWLSDMMRQTLNEMHTRQEDLFNLISH